MVSLLYKRPKVRPRNREKFAGIYYLKRTRRLEISNSLTIVSYRDGRGITVENANWQKLLFTSLEA